MTETATSKPINCVPAAEGETLWFNQALMEVKSPGAWSDGAFSLVEVAMERGRATGLHSDPSDETFYVLDGELLIHVEGEAQRRVGTGAAVGIRAGVPHAFMAVSDVTRFLVLNTPGTHDGFFRDGGHPAASRDFADAPPPDFDRTAASSERHGVRLLGPAPFDDVRIQSG